MIRKIKDKIAGKVPAGHARSGKWPKVRADFLAQNPQCAVCGGTSKLEVHHILPFHLHPELELEPTNLIALCEGNPTVNCHCNFGHLGDFRCINPDVRADADIWAKKFAGRQHGPKADRPDGEDLPLAESSPARRGA